jgi:hypothetical protein
MTPNPAPHESAAALDRLLEAHLAAPAEQLAPSSGFALSVMDAIHQQATEPPPIGFPWRRVLPGAIAILCALAAFALFALMVHNPSSGFGMAPSLRVQLPLASSAFSYSEIVMGSVVAAACVSVVTVAASFRLAGRNR